MDDFATPRYPTANEREFQVLRTLAASSGLMPVLSVFADERHLACRAEVERVRLVHLGQAHPRATRNLVGAARRGVGDALVRAGSWLQGAPGSAFAGETTAS